MLHQKKDKEFILSFLKPNQLNFPHLYNPLVFIIKLAYTLNIPIAGKGNLQNEKLKRINGKKIFWLLTNYNVKKISYTVIPAIQGPNKLTLRIFTDDPVHFLEAIEKQISKDLKVDVHILIKKGD